MGKSFKISDVLSKGEIKKLSQPSNLRGFQSVFTTWGIIILSFIGVARYPSFLTVLLALILVGGRHLGLAILMHDAAHYSLFKTRWLNDWIGLWICGYPIGHDLKRYRIHHLKHHAFAGTRQDPDLSLVESFPVSRSSMRRKIIRDLIGLTGFKNIYGIIMMDLGLIQYTVANNLVRIDSPHRTLFTFLKTGIKYGSGKVVTNLILFGILWIFNKPWIYLIWIFAYLTFFSLFMRIRSLAEHACTIQNINVLMNTRTTYANLIARLTVAPHYVNYHLEHHLLMNVPSFRLPLLHQFLYKKGVLRQAHLASGYFEVLQLVSNSTSH